MRYVKIILSISMLSLVCCFFFAGCSQPENPNSINDGEQIEITVSDGMGAAGIADLLYDAGLIDKSSDFMNEVKTQSAENKLKSGKYIFYGGDSIEDIVNALIAGSDQQDGKVIIVAGYTIKQVAQAVEDGTNGRITADMFLEKCDISIWRTTYLFLNDADITSLEGFLYPDTYNISDEMNAEDIIKKMLAEFNEYAMSIDLSQMQAAGLDMYDWLILSSIVQKEGTTHTYSDVAGVFMNRIASSMRLQSDATRAYELERQASSDELLEDTPYNTYTRDGLTPTPICNPGLDCMKATATPTASPYLFFFTSNDENGYIQFHFSETLDEHQEQIEIYGLSS